MTGRSQEQQEYRNHLAHTIKDLRWYNKWDELAKTLLDNEKNGYDYIESLGEDRKLDAETSKKRAKHNLQYVVMNMEKFNLDNNEIANKILTRKYRSEKSRKQSIELFIENLDHFRWLNWEIADKIMDCSSSLYPNLPYNTGFSHICDNIDSFLEPVHQKIVEYALWYEDASYCYLIIKHGNMKNFKWIDKKAFIRNVMKKELGLGILIDVLKNIEDYDWLTYNELAGWMIENWNLDALVEELDRFKKLDMNIAKKLVDAWYLKEVLKSSKSFQIPEDDLEKSTPSQVSQDLEGVTGEKYNL